MERYQYTKASDEAILKNNLFLWSPGKSYLFLQNFENALLENLICFYGILSPGKSYVFLRNFEKAVLEVLMCSNRFCLSHKFIQFLYHFWFSWKKWCVFIKGLCLLLENAYVFLLQPSLLENLMCSRNLFKKRHSWKKRTDILAKQLVGCF